jgi:hypothetical protein
LAEISLRFEAHGGLGDFGMRAAVDFTVSLSQSLGGKRLNKHEKRARRGATGMLSSGPRDTRDDGGWGFGIAL